jgi:heme-degrading monooxygenase HmoA
VIARLWRGWASQANAPLYTAFLREEFLPQLTGIDGYGGAEMLQRRSGEEVEVLVITRWASLEAIRGFAGEDLETAHVAPRARELLSRFEPRCQHFESVFQHRA